MNKPDTLSPAVQSAIRGDTKPLYALLARGSGLPGVRINEGLRDAFVHACLAENGGADRLIVSMATLDADNAPGGTALEFLPVCGVAAVSARAAEDDTALVPMLDVLHACAEDLRFRVRDEVAAGLARIGEKRGGGMVDLLARWMDGFFHAAAVLRALAQNGWLSRIDSAEGPIARLEEAFALVQNASRSAARYPGHKALIEALAATPAPVAARFGVPVFDMLARWAAVKDPALRAVVDEAVRGSRLQGRFAQEVARVRATLEKTAPPRRDPRTDFGPTRGRGRRR